MKTFAQSFLYAILYIIYLCIVNPIGQVLAVLLRFGFWFVQCVLPGYVNPQSKCLQNNTRRQACIILASITTFFHKIC